MRARPRTAADARKAGETPPGARNGRRPTRARAGLFPPVRLGAYAPSRTPPAPAGISVQHPLQSFRDVHAIPIPVRRHRRASGRSQPCRQRQRRLCPPPPRPAPVPARAGPFHRPAGGAHAARPPRASSTTSTTARAYCCPGAMACRDLGRGHRQYPLRLRPRRRLGDQHQEVLRPLPPQVSRSGETSPCSTIPSTSRSARC